MVDELEPNPSSASPGGRVGKTDAVDDSRSEDNTVAPNELGSNEAVPDVGKPEVTGLEDDATLVVQTDEIRVDGFNAVTTANEPDEDKSEELRRMLVMNPEDAEATAGGLKIDSEEDARPDSVDADAAGTDDAVLKLEANADDSVDPAVDLISEEDMPDCGTGVVTAES
ncbi:hypothetical protein E4U42_004692 [Claviceps africana]|uniref:Uncharacterized protein n=1 Tax=Claviceps africana TaxID=83212 RepID=A0A8K0J5H0_9HYPO|nr:hypothetical protein E4U42_004692 [Claviceps africana]